MLRNTMKTFYTKDPMLNTEDQEWAGREEWEGYLRRVNEYVKKDDPGFFWFSFPSWQEEEEQYWYTRCDPVWGQERNPLHEPIPRGVCRIRDDSYVRQICGRRRRNRYEEEDAN